MKAPKMHRTRNDLPPAVRRKACVILQRRLADASDFVANSKQAHWNVKGPDFQQLHQLFDGVYERSGVYVDDIAERIVALGGTAIGTVREVAKQSKIPAYPLDAVSGREHLNALADSIAALGKAMRASIDAAEKLGDADTTDLFTGISRAIDKDLWMIEAHLETPK